MPTSTTSRTTLKQKLMPHSMIHGDAFLAYFNKMWDISAGEGLAMLRKGQLPEAISLLQRGIEGWRMTGGNLNLPYLKGALAEALSRQGDVETGLRLLDECLPNREAGMAR